MGQERAIHLYPAEGKSIIQRADSARIHHQSETLELIMDFPGDQRHELGKPEFLTACNWLQAD
jgi:hypothetical protein